MSGKDIIHNTDCLSGLKGLADESVDCCVTSPPYFGLRDYGTDAQIGLEDTPDAFVAKLVEVFSEVRRVLKKEGTLWLNLGDSYANTPVGSFNGGGFKDLSAKNGTRDMSGVASSGKLNKFKASGLKQKDLIGIPWMVAFALRSAGWYLRQDIIWHKPNPMPESVTDRCTKSHEYIFLLSKSSSYYYDNGAIAEPSVYAPGCGWKDAGNEIAVKTKGVSNPAFRAIKETRNKRSVWTVTTKNFKEAHFATFPQDLIIDCIKAGCPEGGTVLDPFMGAGTTALVAKKTGRHYIGFELNPDYIAIAQQRLRDELGLFNS